MKISDPGKNPIPTIGTIPITTCGIEKQLSGLKADKAYGPDGIPPPLHPLVFKEECPGNIKGSYTYLSRLYQYRNCAQPMETRQRMCHSQEMKEIGSIKL